jgi:RNAse (barnase) inhibitor barstar
VKKYEIATKETEIIDHDIINIKRRFQRTLNQLFTLPDHHLRLHQLKYLLKQNVNNLPTFLQIDLLDIQKGKELFDFFQNLIETKTKEFEETGEIQWSTESQESYQLLTGEDEFLKELLVENIDESGDKIRHEIEVIIIDNN